MPFIASPFVAEIVAASEELAHTDWHEMSAGNVSLLLSAAEVEPWLDDAQHALPRIEIPQPLPELAGSYLLITGSGQYIRRIYRDPAAALALIHIAHDGASWRLVWGLTQGGKPSSELSAHLLGHAARIKTQGESRILLHSHPPYTIALSFCVSADSRAFSRLLWGWHSECLAIFPEGVALLELMLPGGKHLAAETANALEKHRLVVWARHGCIVAGTTFDECIGLIEVVEKTIKIGQLACSLAGDNASSGFSLFRIPTFIRLSDSQLEQLARHYQVQPQYEF